MTTSWIDDFCNYCVHMGFPTDIQEREIIDVEYEDVSDSKELLCNLQIEEIEAEEVN